MAGEALPKARTRRRRAWLQIMWVVPIAAAAVAAWLVLDRLRQYGPEITIQFRDGSGLKAGQTPIRYRGVQVGEVTRLEISRDREAVLVKARLQRANAPLASEGAMFWVVRPQVGWGSVTGLGTVISGPEIQMLAGKEDGEKKTQTRFVGLERAPVAMGAAGLPVVLKAVRPVSLRANSPVYYRGVEVGVVQEIDLSRDATAAEIHVIVWQRYARLVRSGSAFWDVSGLTVKGGLFKGMQIDFESLRTFLAGGIEFASPEKSPPAKAGTAFFLYDGPKQEWLAWTPRIPVAKEPGPGESSVGR
jgi:paraquat-inducible protein B